MTDATLDLSARQSSAAFRRGLNSIMPALGLSAGVLVFWEAAIRLFNVPTFVLPAPTAVIASLIANRSTLAVAAQATALEVVFGFVLSAFVGILVALVIVRFERFGKALYPLIVLFQNVPKVALAPIFILWFGYDLAPKVLLIVVIAFFPVTIDMLVGLQSVEPAFVALMRSVGASTASVPTGPRARGMPTPISPHWSTTRGRATRRGEDPRRDRRAVSAPRRRRARQ